MQYTLTSLQEKEVINVKNGDYLGTVVDLEVDSCTGKVVALLVGTKGKCCGLIKGNTMKILWEQIEVIGDETILVQHTAPCVCNESVQKNKTFTLNGIFR